MKSSKIPVSISKKNILLIKLLPALGLIVLFFCFSSVNGNTQATHFSYHQQSKEMNSMNFFSSYETDDFYFPVQDRKKIKFIFLPANYPNVKKAKPARPVSGIYFTGVV